MDTSAAPGRKKELRRALRARRRELAADRDRAADDAALARLGLGLLDELGVGAGESVTLYEALPVEPPTAGLTRALQERGVRVVVPITLPDLDLDWHDAADPDRRPLGLDVVAHAALVLAPGLSVDDDGTRLGQGGGCYDRVLPRRAPGIPCVVLLHPGEVSADPLPRDAHDVPVDAVLTADGLTWVRAR